MPPIMEWDMVRVRSHKLNTVELRHSTDCMMLTSFDEDGERCDILFY